VNKWETRIENLRCDLFRSWTDDFIEGEPECRAVIWHLNGCINGCHQPFVIVNEIIGSEIEVRREVNREYPEIQYKPIPRVIKEGLFE